MNKTYSIDELKNLQSLDLENNELTNLPESIGELKNLQSLDLRGNKLTNLRESLEQLKTLKLLEISTDINNFIIQIKFKKDYYRSARTFNGIEYKTIEEANQAKKEADRIARTVDSKLYPTLEKAEKARNTSKWFRWLI